MDAVTIIKDAAKGAGLLTLGCLGMVLLLVGALYLANPIWGLFGLGGLFAELIGLIFLIAFGGSLFGELLK